MFPNETNGLTVVLHIGTRVHEKPASVQFKLQPMRKLIY